MPQEYTIGDWSALSEEFERFFAGAGEVVAGEDRLSFTAPDPPTSLVLGSSGSLSAGMPLHTVDGTVSVVRFDGDAGEIRFSGPGFGYTYRVPPTLRGARDLLP